MSLSRIDTEPKNGTFESLLDSFAEARPPSGMSWPGLIWISVEIERVLVMISEAKVSLVTLLDS